MCKEKKVLLMVIWLIPLLLISATYHVDGDYPFESTYYKKTIQHAIDAASTGDEIIIYEQHSGAYEENLLIDGLGLTIRSAENNDIVIDYNGDHTIQIQNTSSTVTFDGLTIRNHSVIARDCIYIIYSNGYAPTLTVQNCIFDYGSTCLDVDTASKVYLYDNVFTRNTTYSECNLVEIMRTNNECLFSGNTFYNTDYSAIYLENCVEIDVFDNKFTDCYNCINITSHFCNGDIFIHENLVYDCHYENDNSIFYFQEYTDAEIYNNTFVSNVTSGSLPVLLDCDDDNDVDIEIFELNIIQDFDIFHECNIGTFYVDYCCHNGIIEHIDTDAVERYGNTTDDPEFKNETSDDYHLDWNSPCTDISSFVEPWGGNDCGCFESDEHDTWVFSQNGTGIKDTYDWQSFPRLDVADGENNGEFVEVCAMLNLIEYPEIPSDVDIWFKCEISEPTSFYGNWDIYDLAYNWYINPYSSFMSSIRGYKFKVTDPDDDIPFRVFGEICESDTPITVNVSEDEIWVGYFLEDTQYASYALGSTVLDRIDKIKTENWTAYKYNDNWIWPTNPIPTLSYGDLVILEPDYGTNFTFTWQTPSRDEIEPYIRPVPTQFTYNEDLDYMPIYMEFDEVPQEIGVYVNGVCRGGEVVDFEEGYHLRAYVYEEEPGYELEFVQYFGRSDSRVIDYEIISMPNRRTDKLVTGNLGDWARIKFGNPSDEDVPEQIGYLNAYPNPFNPEIIVDFSITDPAVKTEINVYNVKGQKVKTLINGTLPVGEHSVVWKGLDDNGTHVSGGVYFLNLKTGNSSQTKKVVMLK